MQNISTILKTMGIDGVTGNRPDAWEKKSDRLLIGAIKSFTFEAGDTGLKVHTSVVRHDGRPVMVYHTARLSYALCNIAAVSFKDLEPGGLDTLIGENILVYLERQNPEKNDRYEFHVEHLSCPFDSLKNVYDTVSGAVDMSPLDSVDMSDSDL